MAGERGRRQPQAAAMHLHAGGGPVANAARQDEWSNELGLVASRQDRPAFERLFQHFAPKIKAFALATPRLESADSFGDELVQEVMFKAWLRADRFDPQRASAATWIFSIARNTRIDLLRRQGKRSGHLDADEVWLEAEFGEPVVDLQRSRAGTEVSRGLEQIPEEQAQVLGKVYLEGKTHAQVAEEMSLPVGTVKSRIRLALRKLKVAMER